MKLTRRELAPLTLSIAAACASPIPPATAQPRRRLRHGGKRRRAGRRKKPEYIDERSTQ